MRVLVCDETVVGRKGIDSLARLCQERLAEGYSSGYFFLLEQERNNRARAHL